MACPWIVKHTPQHFKKIHRGNIEHSIIVYRLVTWTIWIVHIHVTQDLHLCCFDMCHIWVMVLSCFQHYFCYIYCSLLNWEYPVKTDNLPKVNDKLHQIYLCHIKLDIDENRTHDRHWIYSQMQTRYDWSWPQQPSCHMHSNYISDQWQLKHACTLVISTYTSLVYKKNPIKIGKIMKLDCYCRK